MLLDGVWRVVNLNSMNSYVEYRPTTEDRGARSPVLLKMGHQIRFYGLPKPQTNNFSSQHDIIHVTDVLQIVHYALILEL